MLGILFVIFFVDIMLASILFVTVSTVLMSSCSAKDYCSRNYCNNSKQHTLCKYQSMEPASNCNAYEKTILGETDKRMILDKINSRRNKVAAGEIRSLPPAENMQKLEWNRELATSAQRWADQCVKHSVPDIKDTCRDLDGMLVGQNIATVHGDAPGLTSVSLVDVWYMELLNINSSLLFRYESSFETGHSHYEYFTQLVWAESNQVGCGGVKFKELLEDENVKYRTIYRLVCNFAPAGNTRNRTVYSAGLPCSRCPFDGICDMVYEALCTHKSKENLNKINSVVTAADGHTIQNTFSSVIDSATEDGKTETVDMSTDYALQKESYTPFDYFSHLYDYTRQLITSRTKPNLCKDIMADDFVELLKKKLRNDPMIKDLLLTPKSAANNSSESFFKDDGVSAFLDKIYSKKEPTTNRQTVSSDYVNSTYLVDLIEAVIFRNGDKMPVSEELNVNTQPMSTVKHVMVQAELAEIKQNEDFTGHYFFPEDDEELTSESTETYYDDINLPVSDLVLEDLKMSTITKDFLDDILESEPSSESTTALTVLSPDNINLYKNGHSVMKKFLQNIVDKSRVSKNYA